MASTTLLLIRHGQASFGQSNYDALSDLGQRQAFAVGEHLRATGRAISRLASGTLTRQQDTAAGVNRGGGFDLPLSTLPAWDEFDANALFKAYLPAVLQADAELLAHQNKLFADRRIFQRAFEAVLEHWLAQQSATEAVAETWAMFQQRVVDGLSQIAATAEPGSTVAVVTSGGPIAVAAGHALGLDAAGIFQLNWRIYNASITDLSIRPASQANQATGAAHASTATARLLGFNAVDGLRLKDRHDPLDSHDSSSPASSARPQKPARSWLTHR